MTDLIYITEWFLTFLIGGLSFFPLTQLLFKDFRDKGYIFSKIIGLAIISYTVYLISWLKILTFSNLEIYLVGFLYLFLNLLIARKTEFLKNLKLSWKFIVFEEILFFAGITFWSFVRGNNPDINGLEKFMDFGFVNSILKSKYFPPTDMWYPPFPINYYYFGHLITAVIIKASSVIPSSGYNLMLATLFSLTFGSVFSFTMNLFEKVKAGGRSLLAGILSATLVTFAGNLTTVYTFFQAYTPLDKPVPFWTLPFQPFNFPNDYWYPNATRFIPFTIHEFPLYSFVVSDLHGHVLDIPFVILTIAFLFSLFLKFKKLEIKQIGITNFILIGFLISIMYMTNAWDGLIYFLLLVIMVSVLCFKQKEFVKNLLTRSVVVFGSYFLFTLPFSLHFKPFVSGIGILCAPKFLTNIGKIGPFLFEVNHCQKSPLWQLIILYGFFYFFVFIFLYFLRSIKKIELPDKFITILIILSTILLLIPEFIYVKDIYPLHYRANTMFKLAYEAFIMLSISSGYIIFRVLYGLKSKKRLILFFIPTFLLVYLVLTYSIFAINSYYNDLKEYKQLDGNVYLKTLYPSDYKIIQWFNQNINSQPVILEANGDSYTDYARISANTGLPTVVGWPVHEWLWRGSYDIVAPRIEDVESLYTTNDVARAKELINKYKIQYIVVSELEKQKYPKLNEKKFSTLTKIVFSAGEGKIYKVTF